MPYPQRRCRGCRAEVIWTFTDAGLRSPVDAVPSQRGTFSLSWTDGRVQSSYVPVDLRNGETLYVSHWGTCPNREDFR